MSFFQLVLRLTSAAMWLRILRQTADLVMMLDPDRHIVVPAAISCAPLVQLADGVSDAAEQHGQQRSSNQQHSATGPRIVRSTSAAVVILGKACRNDDAVLPISRKTPHAHLHGAADAYDLVE